MKEGRDAEEVEIIEEAIKACDSLHTPIRIKLRSTLGSSSGSTATQSVTPTGERPIEEIKKEEAAAAGKQFIVPAWWRGEAVNAKVAQSMMGVVPKQVGGEVK